MACTGTNSSLHSFVLAPCSIRSHLQVNDLIADCREIRTISVAYWPSTGAALNCLFSELSSNIKVPISHYFAFVFGMHYCDNSNIHTLQKEKMGLQQTYNRLQCRQTVIMTKIAAPAYKCHSWKIYPEEVIFQRKFDSDRKANQVFLKCPNLVTDVLADRTVQRLDAG
jgi:hypothetical protein